LPIFTNCLGPFSDIMFANDFYTIVFIYTFPTALLISILYYYVIDRPVTSKLWVWLLTVLFGGIIGFVIAFVTTENSFYSIDLNPQDYNSEILIFSITNLVYTSLLIFIFSILIKWKSTNSSHVPF
jgi:hypothetical protein